MALLRLRFAVEARRQPDAPGLVSVDRELSRLWKEARAAFPDCVVTIAGEILPREISAGSAYDPVLALEYADTAPGLTDEVRENLRQYAIAAAGAAAGVPLVGPGWTPCSCEACQWERHQSSLQSSGANLEKLPS